MGLLAARRLALLTVCLVMLCGGCGGESGQPEQDGDAGDGMEGADEGATPDDARDLPEDGGAEDAEDDGADEGDADADGDSDVCTPISEVCDGLDNDCDTIPDNGFACVRGTTVTCTSTCGSPGVGTCNDSCSLPSAVACTPPEETCNGVDDNCDTIPDDIFPCVRGMLVACTSACGTTGSGTCTATCGLPGPSDCVPPTEACANGIDDDCDGETDELDPGQCRPGASVPCTTSCGTEGTGTCTDGCVPPTGPACAPGPEACNGVDDDCDFVTDEGFDCPAGAAVACMSSCGTSGSGTCSAACEIPPPSGAGACTPPAESCNGVDDDCDTAADNGFDCVVGTPTSCTTTCGSAGSGTCTVTCTRPLPSGCSPPSELCNGRDDDCDTVPDNGFACVQGSPASCWTECGTSGTGTCTTSCTIPDAADCSPPAEICNGLDDDCDTVLDEGFACIQGYPAVCTTTCGTVGSGTCTSACAAPPATACTAPPEACNGRDDDCDGTCDNTFECCRGSRGACISSCGSTGSRTCSASCGWEACTPPTETCNGADDDCDTVCDDGFGCCRGGTSSCTTSCSSTGSRTCSTSCGWGSCLPPAEICNGRDDDCDTLTDDGFDCIPARTRSCTTGCGSTGTQTCESSCTWGACVPPAETCNGRDDDCDGTCDNGSTCCAGTTAPCTTTCGSTGTLACLPSCAWGTTCVPPTESCANSVDDDCDGITDLVIRRTPETQVSVDPVWPPGPGYLFVAWTGSQFGTAWISNLPSGRWEAYFVRVDASGNRLGTPARITSSPGTVAAGAFTWSGSQYGLAWQDTRDGAGRIFFERLDAAGSVVGTEVRVSAALASVLSQRPAIAADSSGGFGVVWDDNRSGHSQVYFARIDASGSKVGSDARVPSDPNDQALASVVWNGSGFAVAWVDYASHLWFARLDASGTKIGGDVQVGTIAVRLLERPSLAWDGSSYAVVWSDMRTSPTELYFSRLNASGVVVVPEVRATTSTWGAQTPYVVSAGGTWAVEWSDYTYGRFVQFDGSGVPLGAVAPIPSGGGPLVRAGSDFAVAWARTSGDLQAYLTRFGACP